MSVYASECLYTPVYCGIFALKGTSQRGQVLLDMEAEDATLLEAATKQRIADCDREHYSVCDSDYQSKPCLQSHSYT
jgi:hypothetical protein